ncbi:O-Glycosyl hydrolase [Mucilaginibacter pineti]|uniref:O-Glycosyl hydrolase n=1 Tax=Mucilaginibacter pineti TaxID=1391627 RepID=A0A1G7LSA7_9SPHI|nr:glycoside hydrolase [Mucilaginibacter pineti]SDF51860.1 O-Glycosyl hydrolase [Mucilaginibacter pineti]
MSLSTTLKKTLLIIAPVLFSAASANGQDKTVTVNINLLNTHQTISNFSASDAWACQFVGNWPDEKRNKIADLLFSSATNADGSPRGIALSMWRFNIGAGSTQQGDQGGIKDEWHRTESFLNSDGTYNWQTQTGQLWFLKAAKARGVKEFLGFSNSPPIWFTVNGKGFASNSKTNIAPDKYDAFAAYLARVVKGVEQTTKVKLNYISPVNEPQWAWSDNKQEGSPYNNAEISGLVKTIDKAFVKDNIKSKIIVGEAGSINYLYSGNSQGKGNQVQEFFRPASANYIGDLKSVSKTITAHSYFTTSPMATAVKMRRMLADTVATIPGLSFWQSEYCILGGNAGEIDGGKRDLGIDAALYMAGVIHTDLTAANASAWQWWLAISPYDYKDGLIYVDKNKTDGNYYPSKMLWVLGNYSRFIKPGAIRVDADAATTPELKKPLLVSAFTKGKDVTIVIINQNTDETPVSLNTGNSKITLTKRYTTSQTEELKPGSITGNNITVPARSVVTLIGVVK